jgi:hypothetical protein
VRNSNSASIPRISRSLRSTLSATYRRTAGHSTAAQQIRINRTRPPCGSAMASILPRSPPCRCYQASTIPSMLDEMPHMKKPLPSPPELVRPSLASLESWSQCRAQRELDAIFRRAGGSRRRSQKWSQRCSIHRLPLPPGRGERSPGTQWPGRVLANGSGDLAGAEVWRGERYGAGRRSSSCRAARAGYLVSLD